MHTVNADDRYYRQESSASIQARVLEAIRHSQDASTNIAFNQVNQRLAIPEGHQKLDILRLNGHW